MIRNIWEWITYCVNIITRYHSKSNDLWEKAWYNSDKGRKHTAAIEKCHNIQTNI